MTAENHYKDTAYTALASFQLLEEAIKNYLGNYYDFVRSALGSEIPFNFSRKDIENAPLGTLKRHFEKTVSNEALLVTVSNLAGKRNDVAHKAFALIYQKELSDRQLVGFAGELIAIAEEVNNAHLLVLAEADKLLKNIKEI